MTSKTCDEHSGVCAEVRNTKELADSLKGELGSIRKSVDDLGTTQARWGGILAALAFLAPLLYKLLALIIPAARAAVPIALILVAPTLGGCAALCDGPTGDVLESLTEVSQTAGEAAEVAGASPRAVSVFRKVDMVTRMLVALVGQICDDWRADQPEED